MVGNPIKETDCLVRKILNLWLEECGDKVNKAGSKAREMRRGFRKGSIHFHIGLLKTQELDRGLMLFSVLGVSDCSC